MNLLPAIKNQVKDSLLFLDGSMYFALERLLYCSKFFEDRMFLRLFLLFIHVATHLLIYDYFPDKVIIIRFIVLEFEVPS